MNVDHWSMSHDRIGPPTMFAVLPRRSDREPRVFPRYDAEPCRGWPRRILVATDGGASAAPAIEAARTIADWSGAVVQMEAVYRPRVAHPASPRTRGIDSCERDERGPAVMILQQVQRQRRVLGQYARGWPLRFVVGDPAGEITRAATEDGSDLVVAGIGHHDAIVPRCDGRTAVRMARHLEVALLAVAPECESPRRGLIVLPDGQLHAPTIRRALQLLPPNAPVWIAVPDRFSAPHPELIVHGSARELVLESCGGVLLDDEWSRRALERVDIAGDMLTGVLRLAGDTGAQLIAVPNRGAPGQVRVFLPNIAEPLLATAPCSVLVVPDEGADR